MLFNTGIKIHDKLKHIPDEEDIKNIPQFYRADVDMAYRLGGLFIKRFLETIPKTDFKYIIVDTKVHMLMPGWYPCIPGWHCDDFYRPRDNTPDLDNVCELAPCNHYLTVVGKGSFTEFLNGPVELPSPKEIKEDNIPLYGTYDKLIDSMNLKRFSAESGVPIEFSPIDFHRGTFSEVKCWRVFVRVTQSNHREPLNEIRNQSQVYLTNPSMGW